jgi:tryptophan-rich sensory protein
MSADADDGESSFRAAGTPQEWPRIFRPFVRRGWWFRPSRRDPEARVVSILIGFAWPILFLLLPVVAFVVFVCGTLRRLGVQ